MYVVELIDKHNINVSSWVKYKLKLMSIDDGLFFSRILPTLFVDVRVFGKTHTIKTQKYCYRLPCESVL